MTCPKCRGLGKFFNRWGTTPCNNCDATGRVSELGQPGVYDRARELMTFRPHTKRSKYDDTVIRSIP